MAIPAPPIVDGTEQNLSPAIQSYILKNTAIGRLRLVLFRAADSGLQSVAAVLVDFAEKHSSFEAGAFL